MTVLWPDWKIIADTDVAMISVPTRRIPLAPMRAGRSRGDSGKPTVTPGSTMVPSPIASVVSGHWHEVVGLDMRRAEGGDR